jgi:hypothetical protein
MSVYRTIGMTGSEDFENLWTLKWLILLVYLVSNILTFKIQNLNDDTWSFGPSSTGVSMKERCYGHRPWIWVSTIKKAKENNVAIIKWNYQVISWGCCHHRVCVPETFLLRGNKKVYKISTYILDLFYESLIPYNKYKVSSYQLYIFDVKLNNDEWMDSK